ncbi:ROK family transcriptional regulator [Actinacidiphila rubida]|uniref:Sugar kinase of the NBD/HSP70 family, may contain an N-terminal HTH domain n=1 Tax=Actinacidiphila rubida TaxID=310780 RepID=A0A1H8KPG6_9ACTN|nr:ROK family protein [Actinacidiphila rubida]SEN94516.1 Sugar kinase of the NBD/HSP70 family, may contain an N-terminal HTH domain [Actinacidiphila rubida]
MAAVRGPRTSTALLESAVLACFHPATALNRAEIAGQTGLSRTVVTSLVNTLVARGDLAVVPAPRLAGPGRPAYSYRLSTALAPVALVRLDGAVTAVTLTNGSRPAVTRTTTTLPGEPGWEEEILRLMAAGRGRQPEPDPGQAPERVSRSPAAVRRVVVSAPFPVMPEVAESRASFREDIARTLLLRAFPGPVHLVNDAHLAALGEAVYGAAEGLRSSIHLVVRDGVGAGLVIDGRLFTGADGAAGEVAHVQVVPDGPECCCGNHGCLATQVTHKEADLALSALHERSLTPGEADALVAAGDRRALGYYRELGDLVARALAGTLTVLTPDAIVVDARLGPAHVPFAATLAAGLARHCPPAQIQNLRLVRGRLADAQASGAAAYDPAADGGM